MHHDYHFATERNGTQRHLLEHPEPGGLVRALRHRLDRPEGPTRPHDLPHEGLGVPGRHDGIRARRYARSTPTKSAAAGSTSTHARTSGDTVATDVHGTRRSARRRRRQPVDPARRRLAPVAARANDGSRLHRRTRDAAGDRARRVREARIARPSCARSRTIRSATPSRSGRSWPTSGCSGSRSRKWTVARACRCSTPRSSTRSSVGRSRRRRTS